MRKSFFAMVAFAALLVTPFTAAQANEDFDYFQHDFSATSKNMTASARIYSGADFDYYHAQLDVQPMDGLVVGFRYTDFEDVQEYRGTASYMAFATDTFYVTPILSYHYVDSSQDLNHFRLGLRLGADYQMNDQLSLWGWHEPRMVAMDGDVEFVGSKSEVGISTPLGPVSVGPFVQMILDDEYQNASYIAGTKLSVSF
jgi:hypothetical protein